MGSLSVPDFFVSTAKKQMFRGINLEKYRGIFYL